MLLKILLSGDGGQGIQTMSDLICRAVFESGLEISHIPNYGLEQRGGVSLAFIKISDQKISYPKFIEPDILLIMSGQARERTKRYQIKDIKILDIDNYQNVLSAENIKTQSHNIFFLGMLAKILEEKKACSKEKIFQLLSDKLSTKSNWEDNKRAFEVGSQH